MKKIQRMIACMLLASLSVATQAQVIRFNANPTTNTCPADWTLVIQQCPVGTLGSGDATVLSCNMVDIVALYGGGWGLIGTYTPARNMYVPPGYVCFFSACNQQSILTTCYGVRLENDEPKFVNPIKVPMHSQPASAPSSGERP